MPEMPPSAKTPWRELLLPALSQESPLLSPNLMMEWTGQVGLWSLVPLGVVARCFLGESLISMVHQEKSLSFRLVAIVGAVLIAGCLAYTTGMQGPSWSEKQRNRFMGYYTSWEKRACWKKY